MDVTGHQQVVILYKKCQANLSYY